MQSNNPSFFRALVFFLCILTYSACGRAGPLGFTLPEEADWQLISQNDAVQIARSPTTAGYDYIRATVTVNGVPADFVAMLDDVNTAHLWIANCKSVEQFPTTANNTRWVRTIFNAPWPVKDRDMVTMSTMTVDAVSGVVSIVVTDAADSLPVDNALVRMQGVHGMWTLTPLSNNQFKIRYVGYGEPAGAIPTWLANSLLEDSTRETFQAIKEHLSH